LGFTPFLFYSHKGCAAALVCSPVFPNPFRLAAPYNREIKLVATSGEPIASCLRFDDILKKYF